MLTKTKPQPEKSIFDKIRALESECHEFISKAVDRQKEHCPGVPRQVLENILRARSGDNVFLAVLNLESADV
jgi:hypothetical protein